MREWTLLKQKTVRVLTGTVLSQVSFTGHTGLEHRKKWSIKLKKAAGDPKISLRFLFSARLKTSKVFEPQCDLLVLHLTRNLILKESLR